MFRYKKLIGRSLHSRTLPTQKTEAKVACKVVDIISACRCPAGSPDRRGKGRIPPERWFVHQRPPSRSVANQVDGADALGSLTAQ